MFVLRFFQRSRLLVRMLRWGRQAHAARCECHLHRNLIALGPGPPTNPTWYIVCTSVVWVPGLPQLVSATPPLPYCPWLGTSNNEVASMCCLRLVAGIIAEQGFSGCTVASVGEPSGHCGPRVPIECHRVRFESRDLFDFVGASGWRQVAFRDWYQVECSYSLYPPTCWNRLLSQLLGYRNNTRFPLPLSQQWAVR
jgi:hypothetical protein